MTEKSKRTTKGERTRQRILDAALELFLEQGYEETTMRQVAGRADVAVGNAYYYFGSKEHLVQGFYARTEAEHEAAVRPRLPEVRGLRERIELVLRTKIETSEPYHRFSGILFKSAADPKSPLNPFSAESREVREQSVELMKEVVRDSNAKVHSELAEPLPELLWLYLMAVILFWIHDESEGFKRTYRLIDHTSGLVSRLVALSSLPLMGPIRRRVLALLDDLKPVSTAPEVK